MLEKILLISTLNVVIYHASAQSLDDVMTRYFDAIGGERRLAQVQSAQKEHLLITFYPKVDTAVVNETIKLPYNLFAQTFRYAELSEEQIANEKKSIWLFYKPYPWKVEREQQKQKILEAQFLLELYRRNKLKLEPRTSIDPDNTVAIASKIKEGPDYPIFFFDKTNSLLVAKRWGTNMVLFRNYKTTDSLVVPMLIETRQGNTIITKDSITKFVLNPNPPDSLFYERDFTVPLSNKPLASIEIADPAIQDKPLEDFLNQYRGKNILIDLWATWCGPCKHEFRFYDEDFYQFLSSKEIRMVFVSFDEPKKESTWRKQIQLLKLRGQHVIAGKKLYDSIKESIYNNQTVFIPRYLLVNSEGKIISSEINKPSSGLFFKQVSELISN